MMASLFLSLSLSLPLSLSLGSLKVRSLDDRCFEGNLVDRGRFDGSKGEPFERTMPRSYVARFSRTARSYVAIVRPLRYGYYREIHRPHHAMNISVSS